MSDEELTAERERLNRVMAEEISPVTNLGLLRDMDRPGREHLDLLQPNPGKSVFLIFTTGFLTLFLSLSAVLFIIF